MNRLLLIIDSVCGVLGFGTVAYILTQVDVTTSPQIWVAVLILSMMIGIWGAFALVGYSIRWLFARDKSLSRIIWRSHRQALWIALLVGMHLTLKGFLLWNVFNASILTLAVLMLEMIFLNQESVKS